MEEAEVIGCRPSCTWPCMAGCTWERCCVIKREGARTTVRMADNNEELVVLNKYVRGVGEAGPVDFTGPRASRKRKAHGQ